MNSKSKTINLSRHPYFLRTVSSLLSLIFCFTQISDFSSTPLYAQTRTGIRGSRHAATASLPSSASAKLQKIRIPSGLGTLHQYRRGNSGQWVIHILDAHANPSAQISIKGLIHFLRERYGISTTAMEGAEGPLDAVLLGTYPDKTKLKKFLEQRLKKGELSGAAVDYVLHSEKANAVGIEDWKVYEQNVRFYLQAQDTRPALDEKLKSLKEELNSLKRIYYPAAFLELDKQIVLWQEKHDNLPELLKLLRCPSQEGDVKRVNVDHFEAGLQKRITSIERRCLKMDETRQLDRLSRTLRLLKKFSRLELSSEEWEKLIRPSTSLSDHSFPVIPDGRRPIRDPVLSAKVHGGSVLLRGGDSGFRRNDTSSKNVSNSVIELQSKISTLVKNLPSNYPHHQSFYRSVIRRDRIFLKKIETLLSSASPDTKGIVLVTGGFHAEHLSRGLDPKYNYIQIIPTIPEFPEENNYEKFMRGEVSWQSYLTPQNGAVRLYDAFHRFAVDQLINVENFHTLKLWRDNLIRYLSSTRRLPEAAAYTSFLDDKTAKPTFPSGMEHLTKDWEARVDRFIDQIQSLEKSGKLSAASVRNLLQNATTAFPAAAASFSRRAVFRSHARSELRHDDEVGLQELAAKVLDEVPGQERRLMLRQELSHALGQFAAVLPPGSRPKLTTLFESIDWEHSNFTSPYRLHAKLPLTLAFKPEVFLNALPPELQFHGIPESDIDRKKEFGIPWRIFYTYDGNFSESLLTVYGDEDIEETIIAEGSAAYLPFTTEEDYLDSRIKAFQFAAKHAHDLDHARNGSSPFDGAQLTITARPGVDKRKILKRHVGALVTSGILGTHVILSHGPGVKEEEADVMLKSAYDFAIDMKRFNEGLLGHRYIAEAFQKTLHLIVPAWVPFPERFRVAPILGVSEALGGIPKAEGNIDGTGPAAAFLAAMRHPYVIQKYFNDVDFLDNPFQKKVKVVIVGDGDVANQIITVLAENPAHDRIQIVGIVGKGEEIYAEEGLDWGFLRDLGENLKHGRLLNLTQMASQYNARHPEIKINQVPENRGDAYSLTRAHVLFLASPPQTFSLQDTEKFHGKVILEANPNTADQWAVEAMHKNGILYIPYSSINVGAAIWARYEFLNQYLHEPVYDTEFQILDSIIGYAVANIWGILDRMKAVDEETQGHNVPRLSDLVRGANQKISEREHWMLRELYQISKDWSLSASLETFREMYGKIQERSESEREALTALVDAMVGLVKQNFPKMIAIRYAVFEQIYGDYAFGKIFSESYALEKFEKLKRDLNSPSKYLRRNAAYLLGQINHPDERKPEMVRLLGKVLNRGLARDENDEYYRVRLEAAKSIYKINHPDSLSYLLDRYSNPKENDRGVRKWIVKGLFRLLRGSRDFKRHPWWDEQLKNAEESIHVASDKISRLRPDHLESTQIDRSIQAPYEELGLAYYRQASIRQLLGMKREATEAFEKAVENFEISQKFGGFFPFGIQQRIAETLFEEDKVPEARKALLKLIVPSRAKKLFRGQDAAPSEPPPLETVMYKPLQQMFAIDGFSPRLAEFLGNEVYDYVVSTFVNKVVPEILRQITAARRREETLEIESAIQDFSDLSLAEDIILQDIRESNFSRRVSIYPKYTEHKIYYDIMILLATGIYSFSPKLEEKMIEFISSRPDGKKIGNSEAGQHFQKLLDKLKTAAARSELRMGEIKELGVTQEDLDIAYVAAIPKGEKLPRIGVIAEQIRKRFKKEIPAERLGTYLLNAVGYPTVEYPDRPLEPMQDFSGIPGKEGVAFGRAVNWSGPERYPELPFVSPGENSEVKARAVRREASLFNRVFNLKRYQDASLEPTVELIQATIAPGQQLLLTFDRASVEKEIQASVIRAMSVVRDQILRGIRKDYESAAHLADRWAAQMKEELRKQPPLGASASIQQVVLFEVRRSLLNFMEQTVVPELRSYIVTRGKDLSGVLQAEKLKALRGIFLMLFDAPFAVERPRSDKAEVERIRERTRIYRNTPFTEKGHAIYQFLRAKKLDKNQISAYMVVRGEILRDEKIFEIMKKKKEEMLESIADPSVTPERRVRLQADLKTLNINLEKFAEPIPYLRVINERLNSGSYFVTESESPEAHAQRMSEAIQNFNHHFQSAEEFAAADPEMKDWLTADFREKLQGLKSYVIDRMRREAVNPERLMADFLAEKQLVYFNEFEDLLRDRKVDSRSTELDQLFSFAMALYYQLRWKKNVIQDYPEVVFIAPSYGIVTYNDFGDMNNKYPNLEATVDRGATRTSHYVSEMIASRRIPIFGVQGLPEAGIDDGAPVVVDGRRGIVYIHPRVRERIEMYEKRKRALMKDEYFQEMAMIPVTLNGLELKQMAEISKLEELIKDSSREDAFRAGLWSIGLFRLESLFLESTREGIQEDLERMTEAIEEIFKSPFVSSKDSKAYIRIFDVARDKLPDVLKAREPQEIQRILKEHPGFDFYLQHPDFWRFGVLQIKAMLLAKYRSKYEGELGILFPRVETQEHAVKINEMVREAAEEVAASLSALITDKSRNQLVSELMVNVKRGFMIETLKASRNREMLLKESDFGSLGTSDFSESILKQENPEISRADGKYAAQFAKLHPQLLKEMWANARQAQTLGKVLDICGEWGSSVRVSFFLAAMFLRYGVQVYAVAHPSESPRMRAFLRRVTPNDLAVVFDPMFERLERGEDLTESDIQRIQALEDEVEERILNSDEFKEFEKNFYARSELRSGEEDLKKVVEIGSSFEKLEQSDKSFRLLMKKLAAWSVEPALIEDTRFSEWMGWVNQPDEMPLDAALKEYAFGESPFSSSGNGVFPLSDFLLDTDDRIAHYLDLSRNTYHWLDSRIRFIEDTKEVTPVQLSRLIQGAVYLTSLFRLRAEIPYLSKEEFDAANSRFNLLLEVRQAQPVRSEIRAQSLPDVLGILTVLLGLSTSPAQVEKAAADVLEMLLRDGERFPRYIKDEFVKNRLTLVRMKVEQEKSSGMQPLESLLTSNGISYKDFEKSLDRFSEAGTNEWVQAIQDNRIQKFSWVVHYSPELDRPFSEFMRRIDQAIFINTALSPKNFKFHFVIPNQFRDEFRKFMQGLTLSGFHLPIKGYEVNEDESLSQNRVSKSLEYAAYSSGGFYGFFFVEENLLSRAQTIQQTRTVLLDQGLSPEHAFALVPALSMSFALDRGEISAEALKQAVPESLAGSVEFSGRVRILAVLSQLLAEAAHQQQTQISA